MTSGAWINASAVIDREGGRLSSALGLSFEHGVLRWRLTRDSTLGLQIGAVWGPILYPVKRLWRELLRDTPMNNPWTDPASPVVGFPWIVLPWFHVWWYLPRRDARPTPVGEGATFYPVVVRHPGRFYIGGKVYRVDKPPDGWKGWRERYLAGDMNAINGIGDPWAQPADWDRWFVCPTVSFRTGF